MLRENCLPYQDDLVAYSLGALDAGEISALQTHLETCKDCQAELAEYQKIATGLLHSIPPQTPPAPVRRRLKTRLPAAQDRTLGPIARFLGQFATTAMTVALLILNLISNRQIRDLQQRQNALVERLATERSALAMLAYPGTRALEVNTDVQNMTGSILLDKDKTTAVLVLQNLPELAAGQTYQIWLIDAHGDRTSGGLFIPAKDEDYTTASIQSTQPIGKFVGVGVTVEPWGGSEHPTGRRVLLVSW